MEIAVKIQTDFLESEKNLLRVVDEILKNDFSKEQKESIAFLEKVGFRNFEQLRDLVKNQNLKKEKNQIEEIRPFFKGFKFIGESGIDAILEKYNLIMREPKEFTSNIPLEAVNYIKDFTEKSKKVNIDYNVFDFYIIAPKEMFNPKLRTNDDPIIVACRRNTRAYIMVYAWGAEINILNNEEI